MQSWIVYTRNEWVQGDIYTGNKKRDGSSDCQFVVLTILDPAFGGQAKIGRFETTQSRVDLIIFLCVLNHLIHQKENH